MDRWVLKNDTFIRILDGAKVPLEDAKRFIREDYAHSNTMEFLDVMDLILDNLHARSIQNSTI